MQVMILQCAALYCFVFTCFFYGLCGFSITALPLCPI